MAAAAQKPQTRRASPRIDAGKPSRAKAKHRQILDAARELFLGLGFDTTSMDAIARQAGVSKATLYVHFDDKDDLLLALVNDECRRFGPKTLWQDNGEPIDLRKGLRAIARTFLEGFLDQRGLAMHRLIMSCASRYPRVADVFMKAGPERCDADVAAFLRAAQAQRLVDIPDIRLAATQFLSLVQGKEILKWSLSMIAPSEAQHRALIEGGINVFLAAYERDPATTRQPDKPKRSRSAKSRARH
ncbi:TetR/AcrR family transcriptional regulator [Bradyrhizobium sp. BR13661]|uniref:TetR/AcrR family transcriptional regulator n=1 Tax=Bradyrhizobium sp. BR13661 TaxID=2940622 RepID=UPI00247620BD|nr:TetR/AcrR family transcriptional regulator [Bradyrhizobium sp. BR13661]MDH6258379.1 TetR/AcrR family transcriptional repressor of mexJK operon [Bradyrhizobium sp. BR13661]